MQHDVNFSILSNPGRCVLSSLLLERVGIIRRNSTPSSLYSNSPSPNPVKLVQTLYYKAIKFHRFFQVICWKGLCRRLSRSQRFGSHPQAFIGEVRANCLPAITKSSYIAIDREGLCRWYLELKFFFDKKSLCFFVFQRIDRAFLLFMFKLTYTAWTVVELSGK